MYIAQQGSLLASEGGEDIEKPQGLRPWRFIIKSRVMKRILLFLLLLAVNYTAFAQDNQNIDGSSLDKAFVIKGEFEQVIYREDSQLRRLFWPKNIKWKIINRTIKSFGVLNCKNLRRGETKVIHLIEVDLLNLGEKGTFYFDITDSYAQICAGCSGDTVPKQNAIAQEMVY